MGYILGIILAICIIGGIIISIKEFIEDHIEGFLVVAFFVVVFIVAFFANGYNFWSAALFTGGVLLVIWLCGSIAQWYKEYNKKKLKEHLDYCCTNLGCITIEKLNSKLRWFQNKKYPDGSSYKDIVIDFLYECEGQMCEEIEKKLHPLLIEEGMLDQTLAMSLTTKSAEKITHVSTIAEVFQRAVRQMEQKKIIDRPTDDKQTLHCIGVQSAANFESVELELDDLDDIVELDDAAPEDI
ncbi:MAG: hypothetical protein RR415_02830 [Ruthenibacterium sp.]